MNVYLRILTCSLFLILAGAALGQPAAPRAPSPIVTDRPGFLFSSLTAGRGAWQTEWGIPAVSLNSADGADTRLSSLTAGSPDWLLGLGIAARF